MVASVSGSDAGGLRHDPVFKTALDQLPESGRSPCSRSTISRLETPPDLRAPLLQTRWRGAGSC